MMTERYDPVVAQRLKREPAIVGKLARFPSMRLSQMQDIAGCRAVLPFGRLPGVHAVRRRIRTRWEVVADLDYNAEPKATGYRAHHVVVRRDDRLVEIQLRTAGQHRWAETVESFSAATGLALKEGEGPPELLGYLRLWAEQVAIEEAGGRPSPEIAFQMAAVALQAMVQGMRRWRAS